MKSTSPERRAETRVAFSLMGVRRIRQHCLCRAFPSSRRNRLNTHFTPGSRLDNHELAGARFVLVGKGIAGLDDGVLGLTLLVGPGIELAVHNEDVSGHVLEERVGFGGLDVHGVIVYDDRTFEGLEQGLEVLGCLDALDRPFDVFGGEGVAGVKLDAPCGGRIAR